MVLEKGNPTLKKNKLKISIGYTEHDYFNIPVLKDI